MKSTELKVILCIGHIGECGAIHDVQGTGWHFGFHIIKERQVPRRYQATMTGFIVACPLDVMAVRRRCQKRSRTGLENSKCAWHVPSH